MMTHDVYVEKSKLVSETLHKFNLLPIDYVAKEKSSDSKEVKVSKMEIKAVKLLLKIEAHRVEETSVLRNDITPFSLLIERKYVYG